MGRVVLVTGVSRDVGRRFACFAAADPSVDRVIGVDVVPPRGDIGDVDFVRADIRNPLIAKVIAREGVDTVVHMSVIATPNSAGGRVAMKELNVIGTMQLLAACQKAENLKHLIVKSSTTVYGASSRDPAMFTEDMGPKRPPRSGYQREIEEIEGYVRSFARRRPDVRVAILRCANVMGPHVVSPLTDYFQMPVIPMVLGFDPRLQFLHEDDLNGALLRAVVSDVGGTFNVAGDGMVMLSQAVRRVGRAPMPMPAFAVRQAVAALRSARLTEFSPEMVSLITYGRGVDTTRTREVLGFEPAYTSAQAFADFGRRLGKETSAGPALAAPSRAFSGASRG